MTTDILANVVRDGRLIRLARAVKPADKLSDVRVLEKLEIERRYWVDQGVDWGIVTKGDIPNVLVRNIEWCHSFGSVANLAQPYSGYYAEMAALIAREVPGRPRLTLQQFCEEMDLRFALNASTSLMLVRHLLASRVLICNMSQPIDDSVLMDRFQLGGQAAGRVSA